MEEWQIGSGKMKEKDGKFDNGFFRLIKCVLRVNF
jgi:hypothetical protein